MYILWLCKQKAVLKLSYLLTIILKKFVYLFLNKKKISSLQNFRN